jgi:hypothetical protein
VTLATRETRRALPCFVWRSARMSSIELLRTSSSVFYGKLRHFHLARLLRPSLFPLRPVSGSSAESFTTAIHQLSRETVAHIRRFGGSRDFARLLAAAAGQRGMAAWRILSSRPRCDCRRRRLCGRLGGQSAARPCHLTMRWSERRTDVRSTFEMTSTLSFRAMRALVRRRSSCSR